MPIQYQRQSNSYPSLFVFPTRSPLAGSVLLSTDDPLIIIFYDLYSIWFGGFSAAATPVNQWSTNMACPGYILDLSLKTDVACTLDVRLDLGDGIVQSIFPSVIAVPVTPPIFQLTTPPLVCDYVFVYAIRLNQQATTVTWHSQMRAA